MWISPNILFGDFQRYYGVAQKYRCSQFRERAAGIRCVQQLSGFTLGSCEHQFLPGDEALRRSCGSGIIANIRLLSWHLWRIDPGCADRAAAAGDYMSFSGCMPLEGPLQQTRSILPPAVDICRLLSGYTRTDMKAAPPLQWMMPFVMVTQKSFPGFLKTVPWIARLLREKENGTFFGGCITTAPRAARAPHGLCGCEGRYRGVKWLRVTRSEGCSTHAIDIAARRGHITVVQWLSENRSEGCSTLAMDGAAARGYVDMLKWLHDLVGAPCTTHAMDWAAENGRLDVVEWCC
ncbi:Ankyrin repeat-containing domain [Phytophthora cactorum]|nr:Ankyrin repeat-containing domain [Phytophthora cactorum]